MRLLCTATVDSDLIDAAMLARGLRDVRTSPAERAVWRAVDEAAATGRFDRDVERALVAYVPDSVYAWMERFADGGTFPRVRFAFFLESDPSESMRGVRLVAESERAGATP